MISFHTIPVDTEQRKLDQIKLDYFTSHQIALHYVVVCHPQNNSCLIKAKIKRRRCARARIIEMLYIHPHSMNCFRFIDQSKR